MIKLEVNAEKIGKGNYKVYSKGKIAGNGAEIYHEMLDVLEQFYGTSQEIFMDVLGEFLEGEIERSTNADND